MKTIFSMLFIFISFTGFSQNEGKDVCPIKNSQKVPESKVYDIKGNEINLNSLVSNENSIVVFFRGGWCPYCMKHLAALQEVKDEIDSLGYKLIAITPDDFTNLNKSIDNADGLDYTLLSDKDANAMKDFGIAWTMESAMYNEYKSKWNIDLEEWSGNTHRMLPVPSVFIIRNGEIAYQHVNPDYTERLSAEILLAYLKN